MPDKATIALDYSHNNKLTLEASSYNEFTHFLFSSGYKLGKIQAGMDSLKKLESYDCIILSSPINTKFSEQEIDVIEEYVKKGGNLLILSSIGGDHTNNTNLNQLTSKFGFEFVPDGVQDSMNYINLQKRPLITNIKPHTITEHVKKIVFSSGCSLKILEFLEEEQDIKIDVVASGGINTWHRIFREGDWIEEDAPKIPLIVVVEYHKGKIVAFGNLSMFSSLGREYGFTAFDNDVFIANALKYLTSEAIHEGKVITVNLNLDLFYWANKIMNDQDWESISDIMNLALKYFKDNYDRAIEEIKILREERLKTKIEYEKKKQKAIKAEESSEDKILEMVPVTRKREDLEDIMAALEEVTGEKYEISINLEDESKFSSTKKQKEPETVKMEEPEIIKTEEVEVEETTTKLKKGPILKTDDGIEYTSDDAIEFNKETRKHAIWHGEPTKTFKDWLHKKRASEKISRKIGM